MRIGVMQDRAGFMRSGSPDVPDRISVMHERMSVVRSFIMDDE